MPTVSRDLQRNGLEPCATFTHLLVQIRGRKNGAALRYRHLKRDRQDLRWMPLSIANSQGLSRRRAYSHTHAKVRSGFVEAGMKRLVLKQFRVRNFRNIDDSG